jgi:hypothetical protein
VLLGVAAWFEPTCVVRGWLCGEAFYQGRPTSYWSRELGRWEPAALVRVRTGNVVEDASISLLSSIEVAPGPDERAIRSVLRMFQRNAYRRTPGLLDRAAGYVGIELEHPACPPLLDGDPAAGPVLRELLDDPSESVRAIAKHGLRSIGEGNR